MVSLPYLPVLRELPDLSSVKARSRFTYLALKRVLDVLLATLMTFLVCPVLVVAAIMIKLESEGPVIFAQERVGARYRREGGHIIWQMCLFRCYKLRTMRRDSDPEIHKEYLRRFRNGAMESGPKRAPFKLSRDPRVTRTGQFLRKTSLDELPQLINVIKGEMSLVGPRPVPSYEVELYDEPHYSRLAARPGITGIWQVYGRSRVPFEEMVRMDIEYVRQSSIWCDVKLLLLTLTSVVSFKGAA
jgi:lipopolysaccharide/colanic/teichoic acid biosynthesis glycosyltransferase